MTRTPGRYTRYTLEGSWLEMPLVDCAGLSFQQESFPLTAHAHDGIELTYLASGEVTWQLLDGGALHLSGGDLALVQPGVPHRGEYEMIRPCRLLWLVICPEATDATRYTPWSAAELVAVGERLRAVGNSVVRAERELAEPFRTFTAAMRDRTQHETAPLLAARVRAVLSQLLLGAVAALERHAAGMASAKIAHAKSLMAVDLPAPVAMADIAAQVALRPSRFYERFKQEVGQTPADYRNRLRCAAARELLAGDAPILTIALDLGFSSSQYFASAFRKYTGMTPTAYRESQRSRRDEQDDAVPPPASCSRRREDLSPAVTVVSPVARQW
ncbi:MAG TPA: AraC family transcriptional regulator [Armatimonadota bacterium]|jgi:AraC-like DNA-binding protein